MIATPGLPKIFPDIHANFCVVQYEDHREWMWSYITLVRKKHRGKYYLQLVANTGCCFEESKVEEYRTNTLKDFLNSVYTVQLLGKIIPKLKHPVYGFELYPLDPDQRSEEERLKERMYGK